MNKSHIWALVATGTLILTISHSVMLYIVLTDQLEKYNTIYDGLVFLECIVFLIIILHLIFLLKYFRTKTQEAKARQIKSMYEYSPMGYQSLDENGILLDVNPAWLDIFGYQREEVIGKSITNFLPEDDREVFAANFPFLKEKGKVRSVKYNIYKKDKEVIVADFDANVDYDEHGNFKQTHCVLRDVTQMQRNQEERERFNLKLKAKNEELQSLVSSLSHDLQTPLINIKGFTSELQNAWQVCNELLTSDLDHSKVASTQKTFNDDIHNSLRFIQNSTAKIEELISGLSDLAKIGKLDFEIDFLNMNRLINNVIIDMEYQIRNYNVDVIVEDLPCCLGDKPALNRLFSNLVSNSIKFLKTGQQGKITISGYKEGGFSIYTVEDNGIGIDNDEIEEIFKPFRRLLQNNSSGHGLGLNIVKAILERLDGHIHVESVKGQGSKFIVHIPCK